MKSKIQLIETKVKNIIKKVLKEEMNLRKYIPEIINIMRESGYHDLANLVDDNKNELWKIKKYHTDIIKILKEEGYDDLAETFSDISRGIQAYR